MKTASLLMALFFSSASISYFHFFRDMQEGNASGHQQYVAIDETLWEHTRPDLADLRLYSGQNEVPYALTTERGSSESERRSVQVLQPGTRNGKTQFFLDMSQLNQYDRIELTLSSRNFVAKAQIDGQEDLHGPSWATLANTIIYDLSDDRLGSNTTLRLPLARYKYLRITLDGPVKPSEIEGARAEIREEEKEVWRTISSRAKPEQHGKDTVFTFSIPSHAPVERLAFTIDPAQPNFRRAVELQRDKEIPVTSGEISRVHMVRHGQKIDYEQTSINLYGNRLNELKVIVHNGDDPPLKITGIQLQQYERRIYFNSSSTPRLYYGDVKLEAPEYDYAKLFQKDAQAAPAALAPEQVNGAYTGRPDDRPWSERHPAVLWIAIIVAVAVLTVLALRSMKTMGASAGS